MLNRWWTCSTLSWCSHVSAQGLLASSSTFCPFIACRPRSIPRGGWYVADFGKFVMVQPDLEFKSETKSQQSLPTPNPLRLVCVEPSCAQQFEFSVQDQESYSQKCWSNPQRCETCREAKKRGRGRGRAVEDADMYTSPTCTTIIPSCHQASDGAAAPPTQRN